MQPTLGAPPENIVRLSGPLFPDTKVDFTRAQHRSAGTKQFTQVGHGANTFEQTLGARTVTIYQTAQIIDRQRRVFYGQGADCLG